MQTNLQNVTTWLFVACVPAISTADWPRFRGPDGRATSDDRGLPATWNSTENIVWRAELPGAGSSSPIIIGDKIFLTCYTGYGVDSTSPGKQEDLRRHLLCLDRTTGRILWQQQVRPKLPDFEFQGRLTLHGYATSTPAADAERVYVFFGKTGVFAFDHDGNQLWKSEVGDGTHQWGSATSPILHKNLVIVNAAVESGSLIAIDKETGRQVWRTGGIRQCWGTPGLATAHGDRQELVLSSQRQVLGFDPDTGEKLWSCDGINDYVCPSVVVDGDIIYAVGARRGIALAVRAGGTGDVTGTHRIWLQNIGSNVPSPVLYDDHLYCVSDQGIAFCIKADSGAVVYRERLGGAGTVYSSAVAADGKLYVVSRERGAFVVAAKPQFKLLAHNRIDNDSSVFDASPAISNGQLLLRSDQYLYCIGTK
jgi:hypothetical protein